jgi:hypothetical protein
MDGQTKARYPVHDIRHSQREKKKKDKNLKTCRNKIVSGLNLVYRAFALCNKYFRKFLPEGFSQKVSA